jgi:hypothetical protein
MYYVKFDEAGVQEEVKWSDTVVSDPEWYSVGKDVEGKLFKLTASGNASAMTTAQYSTYMSALGKSSTELNVRIQRSTLLTQSDWTQLPNSGLSDEDKTSWEVYRQALRDLPENISEDLSYELPQPPQ